MLRDDNLIDGFVNVKDINTRIISIEDSEFEKYISQHSAIKRNYDKFKRDYNSEIIIDVDKDKLIGCVFIGDKKDKGFITTLWVSDKYRKHGYGSILIKDAINKNGGYKLAVIKNNKSAINLYKKHGFVIIGFDDNIKKDVYIMKLKSKLINGDKII